MGYWCTFYRYATNTYLYSWNYQYCCYFSSSSCRNIYCTDNGATWTDLEPAGTEQRGASAFLNASTGWCAGFSDGDPLGSAGIFKLSEPLGVDNAATVTKFKVYPNPASSVVTISTPEVETVALSVTDLTGKVVMIKLLNGIENTVDISNLATGAYFFNLSSGDKKEVVKILKN